MLEYQPDPFQGAKVLVNGCLLTTERSGQLPGRQRSECSESVDNFVPNGVHERKQLIAL